MTQVHMVKVQSSTHRKLKALKKKLMPKGIRTIGGVVDVLVNAYTSEAADAQGR